MRVYPVPVKRAPLFLHFTYSLCLHAAALSFLISLPVFGRGTVPGGEYVVTLTSPADQPPSADTLEKTIRQPAGEPGGDKLADIVPGKRDGGTGGTRDTGKGNDVAEDMQLPEVADSALIETASNLIADKPSPVSIPPNIAIASAGLPNLTTTIKPFFADVPSEPLAGRNERAAIKRDARHKAEAENPVRKNTSAAVKPTQSTVPPVQEKPPAKPYVPEVLPDPEPESAAVMPPMFIPAKAVISEADHMLPPGEISPRVPDRQVVSSKTTAEADGRGDGNSSAAAITLPPGEVTSHFAEKIMTLAKTVVDVQKKVGVASSPDAVGSASEFPGKYPGGNPHWAGKQAGNTSDKKGGQTGSGDSVAGSPAYGTASSSEKGGTAGLAKGGSPRGAGGDGGVDTGNAAGTARGAGTGYTLSTASRSRELGLLRGIGDAFSGPVLARREGPPGSGIPKKEERKGTGEMPAVAIRVPEELLVQDIKIEVAAEKKALSDISMGLTLRAHPADRKKNTKDEERKIEKAEIMIGKVSPGTAATKTLTVKIAEKGVYIFSLTNTGNASSVAVVFRLHSRSEQERIKEYKSLPMTPAGVANFKFLMPEAIFWDDTDRFSGSIEDSHSVTKFRYETGLLWKEEKE